MNKKHTKVDIWENGCGANVGKHIVFFTGIKPRLNFNQNQQFIKSLPLYISIFNSLEGTYVSLYYRKKITYISPLIYIANRQPKTLIDAVNLAKDLRKNKSIGNMNLV